jgi:tripeptidyl-peptidase-1
MYTFTVDFLSAVEYPMVVSLSYGLPEIDQCAYFNPSDCYGVSYAQYIKNVDKQFMKMGLIGVSVIVCSQDRGTYAPDPPMTSNTVGAVSPFLPEYPGTSPYITSVGATEMGNPVFNVTSPPPACVGHSWTCISGGDEQAVSTTISFYLSGGGFSDVDERPRYQALHVERYINSNVTLPPAGSWNRTGRGFPDVSAMGYNGYIIDGNSEDLVSGTSMSTPIFAAIVALLNAEYLGITGRTLGFLNPILYDGPADIFKDITVGDNCGSPQCTSQQDGFSCTVGWDPVTGLGTPRYPGLRRYIRGLAENVITREQGQQQQAQIQHQQQPRVAQKHSAPSKVKSVHGNVVKRMNGERQTTMEGSMQM